MDLKYCTRCGAKFHKKAQRLFICEACDFHFYIAPSSCNAIIVENKKGEILLVKRKTDPFKDYWDLPGGFIDLDETLEESLIREIKEELGIKLTDFHYFRSYFDTYFYKDVNYHTLGMIFTGIIDQQNLKPTDDVSEAKFFPKKNIPWKKLSFNNVKKALKDYLG
jgi:mutator protein MutT